MILDCVFCFHWDKTSSTHHTQTHIILHTSHTQHTHYATQTAHIVCLLIIKDFEDFRIIFQIYFFTVLVFLSFILIDWLGRKHLTEVVGHNVMSCKSCDMRWSHGRNCGIFTWWLIRLFISYRCFYLENDSCVSLTFWTCWTCWTCWTYVWVES